MSNIGIIDKSNKLQWRVKHTTDFSKEVDFLETVLIDNGVEADKIKEFLKPNLKHLHDPFLMKNMSGAIRLVHEHVKKGNNILIRVDADVDGVASASVLAQFLQELNPKIDITYKLNYEKRHGLSMEDMEEYTRTQFDLILIPDASMTVRDARQITSNFTADILVLDHHLIEPEFFDKKTKQQISREEAKVLYKANKNRLEVDDYTNYCLTINLD